MTIIGILKVSSDESNHALGQNTTLHQNLSLIIRFNKYKGYAVNHTFYEDESILLYFYQYLLPTLLKRQTDIQ